MKKKLQRFFLEITNNCSFVAGNRLHFARGTFRARKEGNVYRGGFIIDSGTGATMFTPGGPCERVRDAFIEYFQQFRLARASHPKFEVCYKIPAGGFTAYPSMTFHFENGKDFVVQPDNMVWTVQSEFCVVIERSNLVNILGTYQQHNYRISYDTRNRVLSYVPADCSADHASE